MVKVTKWLKNFEKWLNDALETEKSTNKKKMFLSTALLLYIYNTLMKHIQEGG